MIELITSLSLWELVKHGTGWIANLSRAGRKRKEESREALRQVIVAARLTRSYCIHILEKDKRKEEREQELIRSWTELSFTLQDLGLSLLAGKCDLQGKTWSDRWTGDRSVLKKIIASLDKTEAAAREMLA